MGTHICTAQQMFIAFLDHYTYDNALLYVCIHTKAVKSSKLAAQFYTLSLVSIVKILQKLISLPYYTYRKSILFRKNEYFNFCSIVLQNKSTPTTFRHTMLENTSSFFLRRPTHTIILFANNF